MSERREAGMGEGSGRRFSPWIALAVLLVFPLTGGVLLLLLILVGGPDLKPSRGDFALLALVAVGAGAVTLAWRTIFRFLSGFAGLARDLEGLAEGSLDRDAARAAEPVELSAVREAVRAIHERLGRNMEDLGERAARLEETNARLKKLDEKKTEFLSTVSHELRTPLTAIRSFAEILVRYGDEQPDERRRYLSIITMEVDRLTALIDDILDLSKIESGRMSWNMGLHDMGEMARESTALLEPLIREKDLALEVRVEPGLPKVLADPDRIRQVMTNLLGNAAKFTPRGGRISVEAALQSGGGSAGDFVAVTVADSGVGIPADQIEFIFDKFVQARMSMGRGRKQGTGLGLPICKEIVEAHGGSIEVSSVVEQGSRFTFVIPAWAGESLFRTYLSWKLGYAQRKKEKFSLVVMEAPAEGNEEKSEAFREAVQGMVRASDLVVSYDRRGMIALIAAASGNDAPRILTRVRARLREKMGIAGGGRDQARDAICSYPEDGKDLAGLIAVLEETLTQAGFERTAEPPHER